MSGDGDSDGCVWSQTRYACRPGQPVVGHVHGSTVGSSRVPATSLWSVLLIGAYCRGPPRHGGLPPAWPWPSGPWVRRGPGAQGRFRKIVSVSGNVLRGSCFRFFILSCCEWSTCVRWRPSLSAAIVTQLVTCLRPLGRAYLSSVLHWSPWTRWAAQRPGRSSGARSARSSVGLLPSSPDSVRQPFLHCCYLRVVPARL